MRFFSHSLRKIGIDAAGVSTFWHPDRFIGDGAERRTKCRDNVIDLSLHDLRRLVHLPISGLALFPQAAKNE